MKRLFFFLFISLVISINGCSDGISQPETSQALNYKHLFSEKGNIGSDIIFERHISLAVSQEQFQAVTQDQIGQTAIKAALDAYEMSKANIVVVWVQMNTSLVGYGCVVGKAVFIPDAKSKGKSILTWEVQAAKKLPPLEEAEIEALWWQMRDAYQVPAPYGGTMTDEDALKGAIADKLNMAAEGVYLTNFMMDDYYTE